MANQYLNPRIQLMYDSLANWSTKNPVLLEGELAIAYLGNSHTTTTPDNGTHPILFKVGPGNFNALPWTSALAADVYSWAKKSESEFTSWVKTLIAPSDINAYTKGEVDKLIADLDVADTAVAGQYVSAVSETDGKISVTREALPTYTLAEGATPDEVKAEAEEMPKELSLEMIYKGLEEGREDFLASALQMASQVIE